MENFSLEAALAKAFVFFLPFRMISLLAPMTGVLGAQSEYFSFFFHVLGIGFYLLLRRGIILREKKDTSDLLGFFIRMVAVFAVTSYVMAFVVKRQYGDYNGNSPYIAVTKLLLDFLQYALILWYCRIVFRTLGSSTVLKTLVTSTRVVLVVGYIQIALLGAGSFLRPAYEAVGSMIPLSTFSSQIALSFIEPSHAAMFLGGLVVPLHISRLFTHQYGRIPPVIELLLWIPPWILTKSSTAYILVLTALGVAAVIRIFDSSAKARSKAIAALVLVLGIVYLNTIEYWDYIFGFNYSYLVAQKLSDLGNQSTASRSIPLVGDALIFLKFPILGCGNGLQGYFFNSVIPHSYYKNLYLDQSTYRLLKGTVSSIPNGQLFFPAILSGYGIVGTVWMAFFFFKCIKHVRANFYKNPQFGYMYMTALLPIILSGFKSEFIGNYYIWFVLGIPYAAFNHHEGLKARSSWKRDR